MDKRVHEKLIEYRGLEQESFQRIQNTQQQIAQLNDTLAREVAEANKLRGKIEAMEELLENAESNTIAED